jgi:hypothetical protein
LVQVGGEFAEIESAFGALGVMAVDAVFLDERAEFARRFSAQFGRPEQPRDEQEGKGGATAHRGVLAG